MGKWILIPDSFKGTMSSREVCTMMASALRHHLPEAEIVSVPVADGGEGSVEAFLTALGGRRVEVPCTGPDGRPITGFYGCLPDGTAVIEMAAAAGLPLMEGHLCPERATTYGVGELLRAAVRDGARRVILGLGGSATNDGGCGCAAALGIRFLDQEGNTYVPTGGTLDRLARIDASGLDPAVRAAEITVMCDIDNPLCGPTGASAVFGPQKGAGPAQVACLDRNLRHLAEVIRRDLGTEILDLPGSGAAGGMGGGMVAFLGGRLQMGIETVLDTVGFDTMVQGATAVLTGEGRIDGQSLRGKVVIGVARRAAAVGVPVIAVVGDVAPGAAAAYEQGVTAMFSTNRQALPWEQARLTAREDLAAVMEDLARLLAAMGQR
ncbi:glycerate kinase [uncultured Oscillibacter sp.]|mgnify:FL=1|uniref:glycerate kinase family protein n=1 Tax=uncultured Oscillibacter sp. TaxID=876091 RepID=UPI0025FA92D4|nr:glycerate kinase [uncultured Oscillibacter sp.]